MSQDASEEAKGMAVERAAKSAFPDQHLAPWMSVHIFKIMVSVAMMRTIARVAEKADRNRFRDEHPDEPLPEQMQDGEAKDARMEEEFDVDVHARGAAAAYAYGVNALAQELHDMAPSVGGLGRRQALAGWIGGANRSGTAPIAEFEPSQKKHFWSRQPKQVTAGLQ